jgi:hypothetical protein
LISSHFNSLILKTIDESEKEFLAKKSASARKIAFVLQNVEFIESITKMAKIDFNKSKFIERKNR